MNGNVIRIIRSLEFSVSKTTHQINDMALREIEVIQSMCYACYTNENKWRYYMKLPTIFRCKSIFVSSNRTHGREIRTFETIAVDQMHKCLFNNKSFSTSTMKNHFHTRCEPNWNYPNEIAPMNTNFSSLPPSVRVLNFHQMVVILVPLECTHSHTPSPSHTCTHFRASTVALHRNSRKTPVPNTYNLNSHPVSQKRNFRKLKCM